MSAAHASVDPGLLGYYALIGLTVVVLFVLAVVQMRLNADRARSMGEDLDLDEDPEDELAEEGGRP